MFYHNPHKIVINVKQSLRAVVFGSLLFVGTFVAKPTEACLLTCRATMEAMDPIVWDDAEEEFDRALERSFLNLERFFVHEFWEQTVLPIMMMMAEQFTVVTMQQAMLIGTFIDAENQLKTQRLLQEIQADIHKHYNPSIGMCEFGSLVKSIATTERRGEIATLVFSRRSLDRQLGNIDSAGSYGEDLDQQNRMRHFFLRFCTVSDRGNSLTEMCTGTDTAQPRLGPNVITGEQRSRLNTDIDFFSLVNAPGTIGIDYTNTVLSDTSVTPNIRNQDEESLFAMTSNLFGHRLFPRAPAVLLANKPAEPLNDMQQAYMHMRSIIAKRSVAENSFFAVASMKAEGPRRPATSGGGTEPLYSRAYMEQVMVRLGVPASEVLSVLGENPSYYAQMDVLTKKIYQSPHFYTNLYESPANVDRKAAAMQAIKLMQKFDMLKSVLRSEASFSVLLELAVLDLQGEVEDAINALGSSAE